MRTEEFIRALAADRAVEIRLGLAFALALAAGAVIAATVFLSELGVRPDVLAALHTARFPFKFVVTIAL
ncbi:MAG: NrsF family protein, partial [Rhodoplanes sp.]